MDNNDKDKKYVPIGYKQIWGNEQLVEYCLMGRDKAVVKIEFPIDKRPELFEVICISNNNGRYSFISQPSEISRETRLSELLEIMRAGLFKPALENLLKAGLTGECFIEGTVTKVAQGNILTVRTGSNKLLTVFAHDLAKLFEVKTSDQIAAYGYFKEDKFQVLILTCEKYTPELKPIVELPKPLQFAPRKRPELTDRDTQEFEELSLRIDNLTPITFESGQVIRFNTDKYRLSKENGVELVKKEKKKDEVTGKFHEETSHIPISPYPLFISSIFEDLDEDKVYAELSLARFGRNSAYIKIPPKSYEIILSHKKIHQISSYGLAFTDANSKLLVEFLKDLIVSNEDRIPRIRSYSSMGWKGDFNSFVVGEQEYFVDRVETIKLMGNVTEMMTAFHQKGTLAGWIKHSEKLLKHDALRYMVYLSSAAPLLSLLEESSRMNNSYGDTGTFKTGRNRVAMSLWSHPEKSQHGLRNTDNYYEMLASTFKHIPLHFDETSTVKREEMVENIYSLCNGTGKGRLNSDVNLRDIKKWTTIILTSGERRVTKEDDMGGSKVRAIDVSSNKMPRDKEAVDNFEKHLTENYGVVAPLLLQKIIASKNELPKRYENCIKRLSEAISIQDNNTADRMIKTFAVYLLAGELFEELVKDKVEAKDPLIVIANTLQEIIEDVSQRPYYVRALEHLYSWMQVNEKYFKRNGYWVLGDYEHSPAKCYGNSLDVSKLVVFHAAINEAFRGSEFNFGDVKIDWLGKGIVWNDPENPGKLLVGRTSNSKGVIFNPAFIETKYGLPDPFTFEISQEKETEKEDKTVCLSF